MTNTTVDLLSDIEARGIQAETDREKLSQFVAGHSQKVEITGAKISENHCKTSMTLVALKLIVG